MNSLNSILLEGNLVRDPQTKSLSTGSKVCSFSIGSNRFYNTGEEMQREVSFFEIETWGNLAERCEKDLQKGRGIRVVGRLKQDRWDDEEGKVHSKIKIVAEHVEFKPLFNKTPKSAEEKDQEEFEDFEEMEEEAVI